MSPRGKPRANGREGLWQDLPGQGPVPAHDLRAEEQVSPRRRACPHCHAKPGDPCTRPGRGGPKPLRGHHASRLNPSTPASRPAPQETT